MFIFSVFGCFAKYCSWSVCISIGPPPPSIVFLFPFGSTHSKRSSIIHIYVFSFVKIVQRAWHSPSDKNKIKKKENYLRKVNLLLLLHSFRATVSFLCCAVWQQQQQQPAKKHQFPHKYATDSTVLLIFGDIWLEHFEKQIIIIVWLVHGMERSA